MMRKAWAYAPGHLTGLFQICDQSPDPLHRGSRGSGLSIAKGVHTRVAAEPADETSYNIYFNDEPTDGAFVSENVLGKMLPRADQPYSLEVRHTIETPLGAGFGSSGGGAISLALALNEALGLGLSYTEAARVAHVAEIECKTGLGTVFAATVGGFGVLYRPGAPGVGASVSYGGSQDLGVVYVHYGPISTKEALSNPELRKKINELGGGYVDELYRDLTPERFMEFSRRFTEHVGMTTPRLRRLFDAMDHEGVTFTMAMFGEVAFTVQPRGRVGEVLGLVREKVADAEPVVCDVETRGASLL
jgi:pantoate kinase